jgi:hypothetical protein
MQNAPRKYASDVHDRKDGLLFCSPLCLALSAAVATVALPNSNQQRGATVRSQTHEFQLGTG